MSQKKFASHADVEEKRVTFEKLSEHAYAYAAAGDPNTGIVVGDDAVMVIDTQATPVMAQDVIRRIREGTAKPIRYLTLSHYHAVRVLGASGYRPDQVIASRDTYDLIVERGEQDKASEIGRFPRLFQAVESVPPGLTWPTSTFSGRMSILKAKVKELAGIDLGSYGERQMRRRLSGFVARTPSPNIASYCRTLEKDEVRLRELVAYLTIKVTEFFRDPSTFEQLDAL